MRRLTTAAVLACIAIALAAPAAAAPWRHDWLDGTVFYQVFVRSFFDSNGDGIGDLQGLTSKLDYLNDGNPATTDDLGVRGLWLMPVFSSPSYHGYDVTDYESIEPDYGELADFEELMIEAERRGIRVILDFVINHTSSQHPWFTDAAASGSFRDWYVWSDTNPGWTQPWGNGPVWHPSPVDGSYYYGLFWSGMPDLNLSHKKTRKKINKLARLWLKRGAAGLRLDAARYLVENGPGPGQADTATTHAVWRGFAKKIRKRFPEAILVGENWSDTATIASYFGSTNAVPGGDELPLNFNFPLASAVIRAVRDRDRTEIDTVLSEMAAAYPAGVRDTPFLTNHDQRRLAAELGNDAARLRTAASILLTLPGVPFVYYGEELGLGNGPTSGDESKRTPMPWDDTVSGGFTAGQPWFPLAPGHQRTNVESQTEDSRSLLSHYRGLIRARSTSPALGAGNLELLDVDNPSIMVFVRSRSSERVLIAINLSDGFQTVSGIDREAPERDEIYVDGNAQLNGASGNLGLLLPPGATGIWRLDR
ncbi:MAG: alpha-amylase [bacterium]|nr:alpha-amylase [bacterium]